MRSRKTWAAAAVLALFAAILPVLLAQSAAAATPAWEPDPNAVGTVSFFDSTGAAMNGGSNLSRLFTYAEASTAGCVGGNPKASIKFAFPDHTLSNTLNWFVQPVSVSSLFPNASAPSPINTFTNPVVTTASGDVNLTAALGAAQLDTTAGYANVIQVRLYQSGCTKFWASDISYDSQAGTWTQVYPAPAAGPQSTTTTLTTTETSPQAVGTPIHLNAAVSPTSAAGTVQFKDNGTNLGSAVTVSSGHATFTASSLTAGAHSLTAAFTPTDATAFSASTSTAVPFTMTSPATTTTTSLDIQPPTPITTGTQSTLNATVSPATAVGSVQFKDGATNIGSPVTAASGKASTTTTFSIATHQVSAVFTPTDSNAFTSSTGGPTAYVVNPAPATQTQTALSIAPASPQVYGTPLTFTGTVTPSNAVGSVQFFDGAVMIGSGTLASGVATANISTLSAGTHSALTAKFVPTDSTQFGTSTSSAAAAYTITPAPSSVSLGVTPSSPRAVGTQLTLTATTTPGTAAGSVQFMDGANPIGTPVAVASGHATLQYSALTVGDHQLGASFTPSGGNYAMSIATTVPFTITAASTATALSVTPSSPAIAGTVETLKATITPSNATGSVQFKDGDGNIGSAVTVSGGVAQTTTTLPVGTHSLTASFTSGSSSFSDSATTAATSYEVKQPAATTTTLDVTPASPSAFGTSLTLHAIITPSAAAGSVTFTDGATTIGTAPVASGVASLTTIALHGGSHSLVATFNPAAPIDFALSHSAAVPYTVNAVDTTASLATTAGPVEHGATVTLTATTTPSAAGGSVAFKNGTTTLGSAVVSGGKAVLHTTALPIGTASLTAVFTPANTSDYHASTSAPVTLEVVAPPKLESVTSGGKPVSDGATLKPGQSLTISAAGFQASESVAVTVHSTVTTLATVEATAQGVVTVAVTLPTSLAAGAHEIVLQGALGQAVFHFTIAAAAPGSPTPPGSSGTGALADTGTPVATELLTGVALAAAGILALMLGARFGRRRAGLHRVG